MYMVLHSTHVSLNVHVHVYVNSFKKTRNVHACLCEHAQVHTSTRAKVFPALWRNGRNCFAFTGSWMNQMYIRIYQLHTEPCSSIMSYSNSLGTTCRTSSYVPLHCSEGIYTCTYMYATLLIAFAAYSI